MRSVGSYEDIDERAKDCRVHEHGPNDTKRFDWTSIDRAATELEPAVQKERDGKNEAELWCQVVIVDHAR